MKRNASLARFMASIFSSKPGRLLIDHVTRNRRLVKFVDVIPHATKLGSTDSNQTQLPPPFFSKDLVDVAADVQYPSLMCASHLYKLD